MKYALFLGCTIPIRAQNYEISARKVANVLGIEFVDIEDFACCGFPVESADEDTAVLLAARNLAIASSLNLNICTFCSACAVSLTKTNDRIIKDIDFRNRVNNQLKQFGKEYKTNIKVKHIARVLYEDVGIKVIEKHIKKPLTNLKFAAHYGCHYIKPKEIFEGFEDPENPKSLDELIRVTGATVVDYEDRLRCCTGAILAAESNITFLAAAKKLRAVKNAGADALVTICPFCSVIYEDNQKNIEQKVQEVFNLPILFYTQVLGLALGIDQKELGFRLQKVKVDGLLGRITEQKAAVAS